MKDGVVSGGGKTVTYGQLVGGKLLNATIATTSLQPGAGISKPVANYKLVGTRQPRIDIPGKVTGTTRTRTRSGCRACSTAAGCARTARGHGSPTASRSR